MAQLPGLGDEMEVGELDQGVLGGHDRRSSVGVASAGKRFRVNSRHPPRGPPAGCGRGDEDGASAEVSAEGAVGEGFVGVGQTVDAGAPLAVIVEKVEER
ncbi:hypothetical protein GCM10009608_13670 [Pseudonocardia alaniniphila]